MTWLLRIVYVVEINLYHDFSAASF